MNIIFYSWDDNINGSGSGTMRAAQICNLLKNYYNCRCLNNIDSIYDSIIIFIKDNCGVDINLLKKSKNNNNKNIIDIIDYCVIFNNDENNYGTPDFIENQYINYIDAFIVNNNYMKKEYEEKYNKFSYVIPHHYDLRLKDRVFDKNDDLQIIFNGYIGHVNKNCLYLNELIEKYNIKYCDDFTKYVNTKEYNTSNCHISIRKKNSWEYNIKPAMKLAHAAVCGANIIITDDKSVIDLLDENYPYLLKDDSYESVINMIEYVKTTYNTDVWFNGLKMMEKVKEKTDLEYIVKNYYCDFFSKL